jgi:hypothetical protein
MVVSDLAPIPFNAITQSKLVPICVITCLQDQRQLGNSTRDVYPLMLSQFFGQVAFSVVGGVDPNDHSNAPFPAASPRVSIVFAKRPLAGLVENWWWEARKTGRGPISSLISHVFVQSVSVKSPEEVVPLEAADLFAYEAGHHYDVIVPNKRPIRFPLKQITAMPPIPGVGTPKFSIVPAELLKNPDVMLSGDMFPPQ